MKRILCALALTVALAPAARAAKLDGVEMPDVVHVGGANLRLNGIALRTYSLFRIHIYVAALYVETPSRQGNEILASAESKLLELSFVHDVSADGIRDAWREDFRRYCNGPCSVPKQEVEQFLAAVPAMRKGDNVAFAFTSQGAEVSLNGQSLGRIPDPRFARMVLGVFIGPAPAVPAVKQGLLGAQG